MDNSNTVSQLQVLDTVNRVGSDVAAAQCNDTTAILQEQAGTNIANMAHTERLGYHIDDSVYRNQVATRESIERNADHIIDSVNGNSTAILSAVERTGADNVRATLVSNNEISNLVQLNSDQIATLQQSTALETRQQLNQQHYAVIGVGKDIVINENNNATDIELQASENSFKTLEALSETERALELQAVQNTAQVQYEAVKLNAETAAEMAECCCELKEEVAKTNYETQKLARDLEMQRLRDQLSSATTESLISRIKSYKRYPSPPRCRSPPRSRSPPRCPCSPPRH